MIVDCALYRDGVRVQLDSHGGALETLHDVVAGAETGDGVVLGCATWLVTARA